MHSLRNSLDVGSVVNVAKIASWTLAACALLAGASTRAAAQDTTAHHTRVEAMRALDAWVGEWQGTGWTSVTGARTEMTIHERVERKAGGTVLFAEGRSEVRAASATTSVTHDGIAIVSFDEKTGRYRWQGHDGAATPIDAAITLLEHGFSWSFRSADGRATVRFTITLDATHWSETGEASADGTTWFTFMRMSLDRVTNR